MQHLETISLEYYFVCFYFAKLLRGNFEKTLLCPTYFERAENPHCQRNDGKNNECCKSRKRVIEKTKIYIIGIVLNVQAQSH